MEKRTSRSRVILDIDDITILDYIVHNSRDVTKVLFMEQLNKRMNMSPNALVTHLKRLSEFNLIKVIRIPPKNKVKAVIITANGNKILNELKTAINLKSNNKFAVRVRGEKEDFLLEGYSKEPRITTEILLKELKETRENKYK